MAADQLIRTLFLNLLLCVCVRSADGTTTALHHRPGKEGPSRVPRGTGGLPPSPGLSSYGLRVEGSP